MFSELNRCRSLLPAGEPVPDGGAGGMSGAQLPWSCIAPRMLPHDSSASPNDYKLFGTGIVYLYDCTRTRTMVCSADWGVERKVVLKMGESDTLTPKGERLCSVSEDLGCRRGEFSRKHYGSVELLISSDADGAIQRAGRFRVENGSSDENADFTPGTWRRTDVHLENPEYHTRWYFKYFLGKVHQNYIGTDAEKNPFFLSVVLSNQNNQRVPQYRSILWKKTGTQKICLPYSPTKTLSVKSILSAMNLDKFEKSPREIPHPEIQKDLLVLEEQEGCVNFKFGVLYAKDGQLTDDEMFSNVINGEKATLETPTFAQKRQRTLDMLIRSLYQDLMPDLHKNMLNRRSFSDVLPESPRSARKKEEARQAEFVRLGQALKLKTIVRGDALTSSATTSLYKKEPWESQCFCSNFPHEVVCADSWGQSLLVSTDVGVLLIDDGQSSVQVFDKTLQVKQMHVLEALDLLITRADKGKDSRLLVFRMSAVRNGIEAKQMAKSKYDCRENKLEKTKGCHLYAINTHHSSELRIVVAIRNKLLLITKKYNQGNSLTSVCLMSSLSESPVEEFQYIREICLSDPPVIMTLVDGPTGDNDNMICVAYRHQFDLVNESTGESYRLHHVEASRVNFVAAIDVYEDGEAGLLLCYNYVCYYRKVCPYNGGSPLVQTSASDFHFSWNQVPYAIVCAFPYILAFTTDSIEIRLVVNGNLVHTAVVPELQLVASRSDIYFKATATVSGSSNSSSKETSSNSSPQTPTAHEMPEFPSFSAEGEVQYKNLYKIPLSNLAGRSIERPLKSPLVPKAIITSTSSVTASAPVSHSLSLSRMEIKEIASRTRKELLGLLDEKVPKSEVAQKQKKVPRKPSDHKQGAIRSTSSDRIISSSFESSSEGRHLSTSSDPDTAANREESPPSSSPFHLTTSFDEDIIDLNQDHLSLKWYRSIIMFTEEPRIFYEDQNSEVHQ
ncbi:GTPase-activating Rap/Ran-GAP domain-like protein 3 isoform X6 [Chrysemys picta bellii]|uniref:GTPase-activating Rap/Ran-GAP domain-like protein 3 isoform X6 n=1 Tax=Chrysemys picta bellii TaxID=8478 RepID=UPI001C683627|nr:GTPase-activating Rap/Ran-GAP domain-like protein 3 isoform X8 [Chrysemys picta bellii]